METIYTQYHLTIAIGQVHVAEYQWNHHSSMAFLFQTKYNKSVYVVDVEEPDPDIEATIGDIEEPPTQTERPDTSTKPSFLRTQEINVEPPAKQFRQGLKKSKSKFRKTNRGGPIFY